MRLEEERLTKKLLESRKAVKGENKGGREGRKEGQRWTERG